MLPHRYPADGRLTLEIELRASAHSDHEADYWAFQRETLSRQFKSKVRERLEAREIRHLTVFALAPQPLLIELGRHLCDITQMDVYQLHREPKGWAWPVEADHPNNDIMKRPSELGEFRRLLRSTFNAIKARHGERAVINVFPALPVSAAVEVGRVWMPKVDLPLVIYDQNRTLGGFTKALEIGTPRATMRAI